MSKDGSDSGGRESSGLVQTPMSDFFLSQLDLSPSRGSRGEGVMEEVDVEGRPDAAVKPSRADPTEEAQKHTRDKIDGSRRAEWWKDGNCCVYNLV